MNRHGMTLRRMLDDLDDIGRDEESQPEVGKETIQEAIQKLDAQYPHLRGVEKREPVLGPRPPQQPIFRKSWVPEFDIRKTSSCND